jgi:hypothetical protein
MTTHHLLLAAAVLSLTSCAFDAPPSGPVQHETRSVDRDNSELVKVDLNIGAGDLKVSGGSSKLMDGEFTYNVAAWKPEIRYNNTGVRGYLTINQPSTGSLHTGNLKYEWDVRLNDSIPLDMKIKFGAGQGDLNLGSLTLRSLEVDMGVGELKVDLRGEPKRDYDVHIRGGVGECNVYLPQNVGIYADASGGIGGVKADGLRKEGNHYVNDAYDKSKVKVHLDIRGGVGSINLIGG